MFKKFLLFTVFIVGISFLSACDKDAVKVLPEKIEILGIDEGDGSEVNPYIIELTKSKTFEFDLIVTPENSDYTVLYSTLDIEGTNVVDITGSNSDKIKMKGQNIGQSLVMLSVDGANGEIISYISCFVEEDTTVLVEKIMIPSLTEGEGTLTSPYQTNVAVGESKTYSFAVLPNSATNKEFSWSVGAITSGSFTEVDNNKLSLTTTSTNIKIEGLVEGEHNIIKGASKDGSNIEVYIEVRITGYVAVEQFSSSSLAANENDLYDYKLVTAEGTNWDMTAGQTHRRDELVAGNIIGGNQKPQNYTAYPALYNFGITLAPEFATDKTFVSTYSNEGIFKLNVDGSWEALEEGTTILTVTPNGNKDLAFTVEIIVEESFYEGILSSEFETAEATINLDWNFDKNPDDLAYTLGILGEWNLVQAQSNTSRGGTGDDGNQKMFYLGDPNRVYGVCLESNVSGGTVSKTAGLMWTKTVIPTDATTMNIVVGNNDKTHGEYRIVFIDESGQVYEALGWTSLLNPIETHNKTFNVPEGIKGKTAAIVVEQRLTQKNNNAELHVKSVVINTQTAVEQIVVEDNVITLGQGGTKKIDFRVEPENATNKNVTFSVKDNKKGIRVNEFGNVQVDLDAEIGEYTIILTSDENVTIKTEVTVNVESNVPTSEFSINGLTDGSTYNATYGGGNTDMSIKVSPKFNEGASNTEVSVVSTNESAVVYENGYLVYKGVGSSTVTFTPEGNKDLAITTTFNVEEYNAATSNVIKGITKTEVATTPASTFTNWTQNTDITDWKAENIDQSHGGSKVADTGKNDNKIVLEGHSTSALFRNPINIVWNKILVEEGINSLSFEVSSHGDSRVLESTNFRTRIIDVETYEVTEVFGWTTVANRFKYDGGSFYIIDIDLTAYHGKEIIVVVEQTGSLQNNGDWANNSDSGAGAYLHLRNFKLSTEVVNGIEYDFNLYSNADFSLNGWTTNASNTSSLADVFTLSGTVGGSSLTLSTTSLFISNNNNNGQEPALYVAGLFPAVNNSHVDNDVVFELVSGSEFVTLQDNVLTAVAAGQAELNLSLKPFEGEDLISFTIVIDIK